MADFRVLLEEVCHGGFTSIYQKVRDVTIVASPKSNTPSETSEQNAPTDQNTPTELTQLNVPTEPAQQNDSSQVTPVGLQTSPGLNNPFFSQGAPGQAFGGFAFSTMGSSK